MYRTTSTKHTPPKPQPHLLRPNSHHPFPIKFNNYFAVVGSCLMRLQLMSSALIVIRFRKFD